MKKGKKPCSDCGPPRTKTVSRDQEHSVNAEPSESDGVSFIRKSCIECVEKHLGAAWVLINECHDGYPHKLLVIGHLHEAEDESRIWPKLHSAIRSVRKQFQHDGVMPDFEVLMEELENMT